MATFPRGDLTLMSAFPRYDEEAKKVVYPPAVDPQPDLLDSRQPPDGHRGLPVLRGSTTFGWEPPAV